MDDQEYLEFISQNYPLILDDVKFFLDFGIRHDLIPKIYNNKYPENEDDLFYYHNYTQNYFLQKLFAETFFDCPVSDQSKFMYTIYEQGIYYDPITNNITDYTKSLTFTEFMVEMGLNLEKANEYNMEYGKNITSEAYLFCLFYISEKIGRSSFTSPLEEVGDYVKWGRQNYRCFDFVDEYLIDYQEIQDLLLSGQSSQEISHYLKEKYGIETYLTNILDDRYTGGCIGAILKNIGGTSIDKAKKYLEIKNKNTIKITQNPNNDLLYISPNTDL